MPRAPTQPLVGVIGLGLMGRGIATCLLAHGFRVIVHDRSATAARTALAHVGHALDEMAQRDVIRRRAIRDWHRRLTIVEKVGQLATCEFVIESVQENLALKRALFRQLEAHVSAGTVIASNTSSIPISILQQGRVHPERIIGMHWGEPAQLMRYLEIIPGRHTNERTRRRSERLGRSCRKDPTVLREDIRGFLSNRMMYAMIREACHLVEAGIADVATVDRSFRNDIGWWALLAGPFRWMDLTGIPAYAAVMKGLLPKLSNSKRVPRVIRDMVGRGARGVSNRRGFYRYSPRSANRWERDWVEFTYDIRRLAEKFGNPSHARGGPMGRQVF